MLNLLHLKKASLGKGHDLLCTLAAFKNAFSITKIKKLTIKQLIKPIFIHNAKKKMLLRCTTAFKLTKEE